MTLNDFVGFAVLAKALELRSTGDEQALEQMDLSVVPAVAAFKRWINRAGPCQCYGCRAMRRMESASGSVH